MAPYKLEDNIREKLEARELKPSANAWEKLEAKLDAEQPKKKIVLWYYIAASFVGLLILSSVFFNTNTMEVKDEVVNESVEQKMIENELEVIPNNSKIEGIVSVENDSKKDKAGKSKVKEKKNANAIKTLPQKKSEIDKKIERTEMVANNSDSSSEVLAKGEEDKLFNNKVDEVVASVKNLQESDTEVTATEVENLLNTARRDIQTQRILKSPKVDAAALLQDVEWELEKSFRDKVFDALGDGFRKIRTAVIERND